MQVPHPWRIATQSPIRIVGTASTISAQLAAFAPLFIVPNTKQLNSREDATSRHNQLPAPNPQAAAIPQAAADLEGW